MEKTHRTQKNKHSNNRVAKNQKSKNDTSIEKIFYSFALYDIVPNSSQYIYAIKKYKEICVVFYFLSFSKDIFVNKRKQNQWRNTRMQGKKKGFESTNRRK